jgi:hypothetical protein
VHQRDRYNCAEILVAGDYGGTLDRIEVDVMPVVGYAGTAVLRHTLWIRSRL